MGVPDCASSPFAATVLERVPDSELTSIWNGRPRVRGRGPDRIETGIELAFDPALGYLLDLPDAGRFSIAPDGCLIRCAPLQLDAWRWQRGLFAGPLPFAALAQGIEVFHASAVVLDGRLIAIAGPSGSGKSSLATFLRLAGAHFFTDDVLAVEARERLVAHPGPPLLSLRQPVRQQLTAAEQASLGSVIGAGRWGARIATEVFDRQLPVSAVYFLERRARAARLTFEPAIGASRLLLASSYNFVIRTPERLVRQLDLCARLAQTARLTRIVIPDGVNARALAAALTEHQASIV